MVIKDFHGRVMVLYSLVHTTLPNAFTVEALMTVEGIKMRSVSGFQKIILEGDSLSVIRKCNTNLPDLSVINPLIQDIKQYSRNFQNVQFRHINRFANQVAGPIAKEALKLDMGSYLIDLVSYYVQLLVDDELVREPD